MQRKSMYCVYTYTEMKKKYNREKFRGVYEKKEKKKGSGLLVRTSFSKKICLRCSKKV
jgi:hypothetical protein